MKKLLFSIAAIAIAVSVNGQLLWKVSGNGAKGDSYILGTHHIAPVAMLDTLKGFDKAIASVDAVYGEIVMTEMNSPATQQLTMRLSMAPADSPLSRVLSPEQIDSLNSVLAKYTAGQLTAAAIDMVKPTVVATQLGMFQNMVAFPDANLQEQLDMTIQQRANAEGKGIKGFETIEQQLNILMGDPISEQAESLMQSVRKDDRAVELAKSMAKAYLEGDLATIERLFTDPDVGMTEESAEKLIYGRNDAWLKRLAEILPSESVLVSVGVGHLVGDRGLINQLHKAGYTVTPVK